MSISRTLTMVGKDLRRGPRSPVFIWAILMPVLITFLLQVVFLTLLDPLPRLAIADLGESQITEAAKQMDEIDLTLAESPAEARSLVEGNDVDAGLILEEGFDRRVREGARPELEFFVSGESLAVNRIILAVTAIDLVRQVEGRSAPVEVRVESLAEGEMLPVSELLALFVVLFVLLVAGIFVPAFMLVTEREHGTLTATLVTPVTITEALLAKALLGLIVAFPMTFLTLALNGVLSSNSVMLLVPIAVAAVTCIEIGLIYGSVSADAKTLYTLIKSLNLIIIGPVIFYFFPDWPQWIAKVLPTYYFIEPLYRIGLRGASLGDVRFELIVALAIIAALLPAVVILGRRMQRTLATA